MLPTVLRRARGDFALREDGGLRFMALSVALFAVP